MTPARTDHPKASRRLRPPILLVLASLVVWVAGSALGASPAPSRAAALPFLTVGRAHAAESLPFENRSRPLFILALGSDARPGQSITKERSDAIHIIGVNLKHRRATIIDIPRDSYVSIPGHGSNKITSALSAGGPRLTIQTVEHLTGIHMDYYALTSFGGMRAMIDAIGGVKINVPYHIDDPTAGAQHNIPAGVQTLDGAHALAMARSRHGVPGGDFGRTQNQGRLLLAGLAQLRTQFAQDPGVLLTYVGAALRNIQTNLSLGEFLQLAFTALRIPPSGVNNVVLPGTGGVVGGADVVFLSPAAKPIYADMKADGIVNHHKA
jgi:LCP family protein required for cell wall assembly